MLDPKLLRAAARHYSDLLDSMHAKRSRENELPGEWRCFLEGADGPCTACFATRAALITHQVRTRGGEHGERSVFFSGAVTNACPNCNSTFASRASAQQHVRNAWRGGRCRHGLSHFAWPGPSTCRRASIVHCALPTPSARRRVGAVTASSFSFLSSHHCGHRAVISLANARHKSSGYFAARLVRLSSRR